MKSLLRFPERVGWRDHVVGAALGLAYVVALVATAKTLGFPRDEGFYFRAATDYSRWFNLLFNHAHDAFQRGAIDGIWSENHEHPALMKSLFALSWTFLHEKWKVIAEPSTAFRLPAMLMSGGAVWVTYLFGARIASRRAGFVAAALFALMPRVFFHAHLACFDAPITAMWLFTIYAYWRSLTAESTRQKIGWAIWTGVVYGLTLETKHNAWILPAVLVPHAIVVVASELARKRKPPIPYALVAMATIGPALFVALWPWLWNDTVPRIREYVAFHMNHEYYNMEFLGRNYFGPPSPRGYMPTMILATVPAITLLLFLVGAFDRLRDLVERFVSWMRDEPAREPALNERLETDLLLLLGVGAAVGPWLLEKTPIFGGTKHWMPAYPLMALLAARGFELVARALDGAVVGRTAAVRTTAQIALALSVVVAPLAITAHAHPFGLSSYTPLVGGAAGGADLGLNRQFWGFTTQDANAQWMQANAPLGAAVFIHDTAWDSWSRMTDEHRVRGDLRGVGSPSEAQIALVQHELHMNEVDYSIWMAFGTDAPVYVVTLDGVPIVSIYERP